MLNTVTKSLLALAVGAAIAGAAYLSNGSLGALSAANASDRQSTPEAGLQRYLIRYSDPGLMYYGGDVPGIRATAPAATGSRKLDANSPAANAYRNHVKGVLDQRVVDLSAVFGRQVQVDFYYDVTHVGMAAWLTADEAQKLSAQPGVESVEVEQIYELQTDFGPGWIGAPGLWDGSSVPGNFASEGQGMVAGILDSGTQLDHPSFAPMGAECGFDGEVPKLLSAVNCLTASGNPANCSTVNVEDPFAETGGHGIHVAATVAGNRLQPGTVTPSPDRVISGVAPCAQVRSYRVCEQDGCPGAPLVAAIQRAILDGVDAVNYSISGGQSAWNDAIERFFLDAVNADILVSASGGNTRAATPNPFGAVNHRGPWTLTVAMSTHDRAAVEGTGLVSITGPGTVPANATNASYEPSSAPPFLAELNVPIRLPVPPQGSPTNFEGCDAAPAGRYTGAIALVSRGSCAFALKEENARNAGALGVVVYNNAAGVIAMGGLEQAEIPAVSILQVAGQAMRDVILANGETPTQVQIIPIQNTSDPSRADILSGGSLTGPNNTTDVTKPDVTAPGVSIYAATNPINGNYTFLTGTSMSSPHTAGAALLLRALRPELTVTEIKSALMLTANNSIGVKPDGQTPWDADDVGNGRIDLEAAVRTALVMDESFANFVAANPAIGGDPRTLNLPSVRHSTCNPGCSWTRRVRNAMDTNGTFTATAESAAFGVSVSPANFELLEGDVFFVGGMEEPSGPVSSYQTLTITADTSAMSNGQPIRFGKVMVEAVESSAAPALITVSVRKP